MIRWKLNQVMAEKRVKSIDLANAIGVHQTAISHIRRTDKFPRIGHDKLDRICAYLGVQPGDLMEYVKDEGEGQ